MRKFVKPGTVGAAVAVLALNLAGQDVAHADVRAGVEAYQRGDYAAALREWRPLADKGDPDAQFNLAQAYKLGRGVPADLDTAIGWYRKAAVQNHEEAEALLGLLLSPIIAAAAMALSSVSVIGNALRLNRVML